MSKNIEAKDIVNYINNLITVCNDETIKAESKEVKTRMDGFYDACKTIRDWVNLQEKK